MPSMQKGIKRAEEISEENKGPGFYRVSTYVMKDDEGPWFLRVLTDLDEMPTAATHMFCDTKAKPEEYKGDNWPPAMPAICREDRMFRLFDEDDRPTDAFEDGYGDCYIHNRDRGKIRDGKYKKDKSTPDYQTYALAVVREPVLDPVTKRPVGYRDVEEEFKTPDGSVRKIPKFVIISQKHRNFWSGVEAALFEGGPLGARDIRVTRKGNDYSFGVSSEDPKLYPGSPAWARYTEALELVGFDLDEDILKMASQDWYDRWFVEGAIPEGGYGRSDEAEEAEEAASPGQGGSTPDPGKVSDFREQLKAGRQ